jgi:hypothetical protein
VIDAGQAALVGHRGGEPQRIVDAVAPGRVMAQPAAADCWTQRRRMHGDDDRGTRAIAPNYPDLLVLQRLIKKH